MVDTAKTKQGNPVEKTAIVKGDKSSVSGFETINEVATNKPAANAIEKPIHCRLYVVPSSMHRPQKAIIMANTLIWVNLSIFIKWEIGATTSGNVKKVKLATATGICFTEVI